MSTCPKCGAEMVAKCDVEGCCAPIETYSRIVGYMRPISTWNSGKQQEFEDRVEYDIHARKAEQMRGDHPEERE